MSDTLHKSEYLNSLLRYIEHNISADLETQLLSDIGYISRRKLYYDFYSISGHSVKEYIRKRRLSNALALIKTSDMKLTDIAFQCGYSSHQALCRAVKGMLGLTPSEYKTGDTYYFFPPWNGEPLQSVIISGETIPNTLRILFYHSSLTNIENKAVGIFLHAFPEYNGRLFGRNGQQKGKKLCYELYLTDIKKDYSKLEQYDFKIMKEISHFNSNFATSTVKNDERNINAAWNYLYYEWLQNSMFEYTGEPYCEEYILKNGKPAKLKLYLPIRERGVNTKISLINNPELYFITTKAKGHNAEEIASQTMIDYLTSHYPYIANSSTELYIQKGENYYVCGVKANPKLRLVKDENIVSVATDKNNYLVLESSVMGDYDRYANILFSFAYENGMGADKERIFAVYDTTDGFVNPKIKMYCPIKICTK